MMEILDTDTDASVTDHIGLACPKCQPPVTFNSSSRQRVIEHISAHVLHDASVDRSTEPCGLCLRPAPLCRILLKKTKGRTGNLAIDMKASSCPNLVKFSIRIAAKCSEASPCTNHPMHCPYCPKTAPVVWSYTFRQHMLRVHPAIPLDKHRSLWKISKLEKDSMKHVWEQRLKQPKARAKAQRAPLVISDTHRARLVLRYVVFVLLIIILMRRYYSVVGWRRNQMPHPPRTATSATKIKRDLRLRVSYQMNLMKLKLKTSSTLVWKEMMETNMMVCNNCQ